MKRVGTLQADLQQILQAIDTQAFELLPLKPAHLLIAQAITDNVPSCQTISVARNTPCPS